MAPAPAAAAGRFHPLRDAPLNEPGTTRGFRVDPSRLYDVRADGALEVEDTIPDAVIARHHRRLRRWWVGGVLVNATTMTGCFVATVFAGRGASAAAGLAALLALPLLGVAPLLSRFAAPGGRRRVRARPGSFPPG